MIQEDMRQFLSFLIFKLSSKRKIQSTGKEKTCFLGHPQMQAKDLNYKCSDFQNTFWYNSYKILNLNYIIWQ